MLKPYLDSSVIIKRYVSEPGSSSADLVFDKGEAGEIYLATSIWNFGEVLGVLDEKLRRNWLTEGEFKKALENFASEMVRLMRLKVLEVVPVVTPILVEAWPLILREHVCEADALQIQTCIYCNGDILLSADRELINLATKKGLKALDVKEERKIIDFLGI
ncbi:MAG: type II toxin-antitoxin system VapC family toxin [Candidatus Bathyarchaeia archaeon]